MGKTFNDANSQVINLIGKGTKIQGDLISEGDIRVDGEVEGSIVSKGRLVVGPTGKINGEVNGKSSEISGYVKGKLKISELLTLKSSAKIYGDIFTGKLSIEPGSIFTGSCSMGGETPKPNETGKVQQS